MPDDTDTPAFFHPSAGASDRELTYLAVRWVAGADAEQRSALLDEAGVEPVTGDATQRPQAQVNQTDGLTWVQGTGDGPVDDDAVRLLAASDLVEWVAPALRSRGGSAQVFTVNPTRVLVPEDTVQRAGGLESLGAELAPDTARPSRIPGYVAVRVDAGGAEVAAEAGGEGLLETMTAALAAVGAAQADVRYETIPFLSPTTTAVDCRPPVTEYTPNDPMFATQWGVARMGVPRAWQIARGSADVTVAVIDEGVELGHPDLDVHPQSWNASTDTPDGSPTGNHGTACAGIIGARFDNAQGVAGVAAGCRVMAIATATWADVDIAEGLYFATDNGARVVSMSFGVYPAWGVWDFDLIRDALQYAHDHGLVLVAASGNEDGNEARFPGSDVRTLCVGGSNRSDERKRIGDASSENWWGASWGPDVDVVAPCLEIPTTDRLGADGYDAGDYFDRFNGTSSATPHVAGLAALLVSLDPGLSNTDVRRLIESTCDKISPALYAYGNVATKPSGTWHEEVGYGRVNAERALLAACRERDEDTHGCGDCDGCGGGCGELTPQECRGPAPVPWLPADRCLDFYESREFGVGERLRIRITYHHCLRLAGRQQGGLLYTTTLLPGEQVQLYEYDRFRRTRAEQQRVSVHTSFRQTVSALSQTRRARRASAYSDTVVQARQAVDTSVSVGGGLAGFFGLPSGSTEVESELETTVASGSAVSTVAEQFSQFATVASQSVDAERSLVISSFEDAEHRSTTARTIRNDNRCYAVTYYVRRVNEVYEALSRVESVEWRLGDGPWRSIDDVDDLDDDLRELLEDLLKRAPRPGHTERGRRQITLPTDGTLYEAELAHCASCEPVRMAEEQVRLEQLRLQARRACLETELLELELERRRAQIEAGTDVALELPAWSFGSDGDDTTDVPALPADI